MRISTLLLLSPLLLAGCQIVSTADLAGCLLDTGLHVSESDAPPGARPLESVAYHRRGFYFAGVVPIVPVELADAVAAVSAQARAAGADGIANLRYEFSPASLLKFVVFPFPDWSASISVTGMAYRLTGPAPWK